MLYYYNLMGHNLLYTVLCRTFTNGIYKAKVFMILKQRLSSFFCSLLRVQFRSEAQYGQTQFIQKLVD